ncbi:MAG: thiamine phosphate synthase [bacterium]|nr:thiamine phosphate synthase [bacterium]
MPLDPTLIVITDREILARASGMPLPDAVRAAAAGGATMIQLREKELGGGEMLRTADALKAALEGTGCALTINDRLDVALACGAAGVHLGQSDLPLPRARAVGGEKLIYGVSGGKPEWAARAAADGADYIGAGPIRATGSKADARAPIGVEGLAEVLSHAGGVPVVAIGGVTAEWVAPVIEAGASGIAVIGAVMGAPDPEAAARGLRRLIDGAKR